VAVAEDGEDQAADEGCGQNAGHDAGPSKGRAERKFAATSGARIEAEAFAGGGAALAEPAHERVAHDEQKEQEDAVERLEVIAEGEAAGGAHGDQIGEQEPGGGEQEPAQRAQALEETHAVAPKENRAPGLEFIRTIRFIGNSMAAPAQTV
jgi:hypothetical protein